MVFRSVLAAGVSTSALLCCPEGVAADVSLCQADEAVYFSCTLKKSAKIASFCGSRDLDAKTGYLQYRFGRTGKIELQYPRERVNSPRAFRYTFYTRAQVSRYSVGFTNNGTSYEVVDNYEGDADPKVHQVGVVVTLKNQPERELACANDPTGNFAYLREVVPCDRDAALNMGACPETNR